MTKQITTNVVVVSVNEVEDSEAEELAERAGFDDVEEYVTSLEESVENVIAANFSDADKLPILSVNTYVKDVEDDSVDEGSVEDVRAAINNLDE